MRFALALLLALPAAASPLFVRAGFGFEQSGGAMLRDVDCASTNPPALFGCGAGRDERPLGARGDFGGTPLIELGAGVELGTRARVELTFALRNELDLDAEANFINVAGAQPVRATGESRSLMLSAAFDVAPRTWRVRPFVTAGAGLARNESGAITYSFPSIAPNAVTIAPGGAHADLAWSAGGGASIAMTNAIAIDIAWRYSDLGELRTEAGTATIIRPTRTLTLDIDGTRAEVVERGVVIAMRMRF